MMLSEGIYSDIPMIDYVSDPAPEPSLSKGTILTLIKKTPLHAKWDHPRLNPNRPSDDSSRADIGTAIHGAILGGEKMIEVIEADDWRSKAAREMRDAARDANKLPVLREQADGIFAIVESVRQTCRAAGMPIEEAKTEQTVIWRDGNAWNRARPDAIWPGICGDVKTTTDADPASWIKTTLINGGLYIQPGHYLRGLEVVTGERREFRFIACEINPPYACSIIGVDPMFLELAEQQCAKARQIWARCLRDNCWPSYGGAIRYAEMPAYLEWEWESRRSTLGGSAGVSPITINGEAAEL